MSETHHVITICDRCGRREHQASTSHTCMDPQFWFTLTREYQDDEKKWQWDNWNLCPGCGAKVFADLLAGAEKTGK